MPMPPSLLPGCQAPSTFIFRQPILGLVHLCTNFLRLYTLIIPQPSISSFPCIPTCHKKDFKYMGCELARDSEHA
ncbi:hypothetical protein PRUPE_3G034400 [Prunus persica]|uniref:Uncharacterized protein n=1 Tax=Prunus persica TaxID=3760 RepID=A0A251PUL3_PRUPE|nr:hypothetical protein PRUPE_3G034400 [Prunus persica]